MVSRFSVRLQLLKSLKLYILHGRLLDSDAPLAGGLWNALQGFVLLWKALSVSGLLFELLLKLLRKCHSGMDSEHQVRNDSPRLARRRAGTAQARLSG